MAETSSFNSDFHVELDVGNLCVLSVTQLKSSLGREIKEDAIKAIAAQGTQLLLDEIFKLPSEYHEHVPVAKLPEATTIIPREKPLPKAKRLTKWEAFAKAKGIKHKKKEKLVWDEASKDWKPQYGYRGISNKSDWLIEVPANADPNVDYFGKVKDEKKERVAKNEYQRLRNIAASKKMKVTNLESVDRADKEQLSRSVSAAKTATASLGRFVEKLPRERAPKNSGNKQKFKPNIPSNMKKEKENNLKILQELERKKPKLDVQEAVQRYLTKPIKEKSGDNDKREQKRNSKKNKFIKNLNYRGGKKGKGGPFKGKGGPFKGKGGSFKRPMKAK
ncbi:ribosome biogenesis regulatory protein homolog [Uloborus diversus]|uniref:ribosome biogenesis regulatory protein homolog n=1 Tax=Uloborus diversus TaxID=327109 RepID=UPI00240953B0|nr:ribosome biogenesis regulatory protein homolog [Uloborus diversus]